jgi:hypothetical protein
MRRVLLVVVLIAALAPACRSSRAKSVSTQHEEGVCPEYVDLKCLTIVDCSFDEARGCRVCQCRPWDQGVAEGETVPPR